MTICPVDINYHYAEHQSAARALAEQYFGRRRCVRIYWRKGDS